MINIDVPGLILLLFMFGAGLLAGYFWGQTSMFEDVKDPPIDPMT